MDGGRPRAFRQLVGDTVDSRLRALCLELNVFGDVATWAIAPKIAVSCFKVRSESLFMGCVFQG